jgi:hypothetical protein
MTALAERLPVALIPKKLLVTVMRDAVIDAVSCDDLDPMLTIRINAERVAPQELQPRPLPTRSVAALC